MIKMKSFCVCIIWCVLLFYFVVLSFAFSLHTTSFISLSQVLWGFPPVHCRTDGIELFLRVFFGSSSREAWGMLYSFTPRAPIRESIPSRWTESPELLSGVEPWKPFYVKPLLEKREEMRSQCAFPESFGFCPGFGMDCRNLETFIG